MFAEPDAAVVGEMDDCSHTVLITSIIESLTFRGLGHGQP